MGEIAFGLSDWDAVESRVEALVARAANDGWTMERGEMVNTNRRECCLLGAILLGEAPACSPLFENAVEIIGNEALASAMEGGFENWPHMEAKHPRGFALGRKLCRRYGADPLHPHSER